jgi:hypothetical protein
MRSVLIGVRPELIRGARRYSTFLEVTSASLAAALLLGCNAAEFGSLLVVAT